MANYIKGEALILYVYITDAYVPVACLTSNSLSQTRNIIETTTKCTPGVVEKSSGTLSYDISFEGNYIDTTSTTGDTTKASHDALKPLIESGGLYTWKMDNGLADDPAYYGTGIFSDLELSLPSGDEFATFSGTIAGSGVITSTDPETP